MPLFVRRPWNQYNTYFLQQNTYSCKKVCVLIEWTHYLDMWVLKTFTASQWTFENFIFGLLFSTKN